MGETLLFLICLTLPGLVTYKSTVYVLTKTDNLFYGLLASLLSLLVMYALYFIAAEWLL